MIQMTHIRHVWLARFLVASWLVLFLACSFGHIQAHAHGEHASELAVDVPGHARGPHDESGLAAKPEVCESLQAILLNQHLLALLILAALLSLIPSFRLPVGQLRFLAPVPLPAIAPGNPPPIRKHLHRYND